MANPPGAATVTREDRLPRRRRPRWSLVVLALVILVPLGLAVLDRAALSYAQRTMASEIRNQGFPAEPKVTIKGFPFLTQVASRHFGDVRLSSSDIRVGPLRISSLEVRARDVTVDGWTFESGTLGSLDGKAFVSFKDLAAAGGNPALELTADGPNRVRAKVDLGITTANAVASVTKEGNSIRVRPVSIEGFGLEELTDTLDFTVPVGRLPLGLAFQGLTVSKDGIGLRVTGRKVRFTDPSR
ncbi:LmeA family phospholipid-binding protein [Spirillospora albida]|uniref:LmeA family phospholipid-binding protein n=1 Tax=Spirillospora albida TaxID=58123 RepID=UPI0004C21A75|nr:DUF2993 domain-containing protein [Spirillospora albida]